MHYFFLFGFVFVSILFFITVRSLLVKNIRISDNIKTFIFMNEKNRELSIFNINMVLQQLDYNHSINYT